MSLIITEDCTACDACRPACPNEAIARGNPLYTVDPDRCTECVGAEEEPQCELVCPADSLRKNPRHVETHEQLLAKFKALHP